MWLIVQRFYKRLEINRVRWIYRSVHAKLKKRRLLIGMRIATNSTCLDAFNQVAQLSLIFCTHGALSTASKLFVHWYCTGTSLLVVVVVVRYALRPKETLREIALFNNIYNRLASTQFAWRSLRVSFPTSDALLRTTLRGATRRCLYAGTLPIKIFERYRGRELKSTTIHFHTHTHARTSLHTNAFVPSDQNYIRAQ